MPLQFQLLALAALAGLLGGCALDGAMAPGGPDGGPTRVRCEPDFPSIAAATHVSFRDDVMPVFGLNCTQSSCHAGDAPTAKLYLGVRCVYDRDNPRHCTFPDAPDPTAQFGAAPLTDDIIERVYQSLVAASRTTADVPLVTPGDPTKSFLVDKVSGVQDDKGYDCVAQAAPGVGGPCGSAMPFGSSGLCDTGDLGPPSVDTIAAWVLQGAHDD